MATRSNIMKAALVLTILISSIGRSENQSGDFSEQAGFNELLRASEQAIQRNQRDVANNDYSQNNAVQKFGSGMAQGLFKKQTQGVEETKNNAERNNSNSREDLLLDMGSQADTGAGIAMGLGAAMIGTGIPMSMDILNIPRMVAGIELIAKGAMELAQGASRAGSANNYGNQRGTLNSSLNPSGVSNSNFQIDNANLNKLLENSSISPEEFKSRLASGEFQSGADILKALGKEVDPELMKEGQGLANQMMGEMFAKAQEETKSTKPKTITVNNDPKKEDLNGEQGVSLSFNRSAKDSRELASVKSEDEFGKNSLSNNNNSLHLLKDHPELEKGDSRDDVGTLFSKLFGVGDKGGLEAERDLFRQELAAMGISLPVKGVSIFALVHRQYNEFGKYRKSFKQKQTRIARR